MGAQKVYAFDLNDTFVPDEDALINETITGLNLDMEYAYQYVVDYNIKIADPYSEKILDPWTDQYIKEGNYSNLKEYPLNN